MTSFPPSRKVPAMTVQLSDRTPSHVSVKVFCATLGATFGLAFGLFTARDAMLKDLQSTVQTTVQQAIQQEAAQRTEAEKHFVTREEFLQETGEFQVRFEQRMGELRTLILQRRNP